MKSELVCEGPGFCEIALGDFQGYWYLAITKIIENHHGLIIVCVIHAGLSVIIEKWYLPVNYSKLRIYTWYLPIFVYIIYLTWCFPIAMLVYQRVDRRFALCTIPKNSKTCQQAGDVADFSGELERSGHPEAHSSTISCSEHLWPSWSCNQFENLICRILNAPAYGFKHLSSPTNQGFLGDGLFNFYRFLLLAVFLGGGKTSEKWWKICPKDQGMFWNQWHEPLWPISKF